MQKLCLAQQQLVRCETRRPTMESRELISVSRLVLRPIFASLGLEGYRSRDFEYCKEMV